MEKIWIDINCSYHYSIRFFRFVSFTTKLPFTKVSACDSSEILVVLI